MTDSQTHHVVFQPSGRQGDFRSGSTLLDAARDLGVDVDSICGGRQTCGRCKLLTEDGVFAKYGITASGAHLTPAGADERSYAARHPSKWSPNARLACAACITGDVLVTVPPESMRRKQIISKGARDIVVEIAPALRKVFVEVRAHALGERDGDWERLQQALAREWGYPADGLRIDLPVLRSLTQTLKTSKHRVTVTVWNEREVIDVQPGYHEGSYGFAVDIGSTTIAAHLCDLQTGEVLATASMMNPQVTYGEDLMSRVSYAMMHADGLAKMQRAIIDGLNGLFADAAARARIPLDEIYEAVLVGNTVMHHILLGIDPVELGAAPFTLTTHAPLDIKARELGIALHPGANIHMLALEAGHVGADNLAVLIAEAPEQQDAMAPDHRCWHKRRNRIGQPRWSVELQLANRPGLRRRSDYPWPARRGWRDRARADRPSQTGEPRFKVIGMEHWADVDTHMPNATGICGSGIIEVVAELFLAGLLQPDGRFRSEAAPPAPARKRRQKRVCAGICRANRDRQRHHRHAGRCAQRPARQSRALYRLQVADAAPRCDAHRQNRAGRRFWQLYRPGRTPWCLGLFRIAIWPMSSRWERGRRWRAHCAAQLAAPRWRRRRWRAMCTTSRPQSIHLFRKSL